MDTRLESARQQAIEILTRSLKEGIAEGQDREYFIGDASPDPMDPAPDMNGIPQRWRVQSTLRVGGALMSCPYTIDLRDEEISV